MLLSYRARLGAPAHVTRGHNAGRPDLGGRTYSSVDSGRRPGFARLSQRNVSVSFQAHCDRQRDMMIRRALTL